MPAAKTISDSMSDALVREFEDKTWNTVHAYFRDNDHALVKHQIDSYNDCLTNIIPQIIHDPENQVVIPSDFDRATGLPRKEYQLRWGDVSIGRPVVQESNGVPRLLTPAEARQRNITYSASLYVDVEHQLRYRQDNGEWGEPDVQKLPRMPICRIPLMVGSKYCILNDKSTDTRAELGECQFDQLGMFIVNGSEKCLISTENIHTNKVLVFELSDPKFSDVAEIRSAVDGRYQIAYNTKVRLSARGSAGLGRTIKVLFQNIKVDVPLFIVFRALGIESDRRIVELIVYDLADHAMVELLKPSLEEATIAYSQEAALEYISKLLNISSLNSSHLSDAERNDYRIRMVRTTFSRYFLPHAGESFDSKAFFLGYMVHRLLSTVLGRRNYDDRDSLLNKKVPLDPRSRVILCFAVACENVASQHQAGSGACFDHL